MSPLVAGRSLGGRYTLTAPIASGGMGDVWAAGDDVLGRAVAVKVLRSCATSAGGDDPSFLARFRDEARASASLHHPGIATVFDFGQDDGLPYLVMELVPGRPLSDLIRETGGLAPDETRSLLRQAAVALSAAHAAGIVHRDVKPGNIMVTPDGHAKLTDFGISRTGEGAGHTLTGEVLGTPDYLSPEQALGRPATAASDLYALGVVGHEMLTGAKPFARDTPVATALAQVDQPAPGLPATVPSDLREVIAGCLAKEPHDRPRDARTVAEALSGAASRAPSPGDEQALRGMPPTVAPPRQATRVMTGPPPGPGGPVRRRAAWLAVPAAFALIWAAFALGGALSADRTTAAPVPAVPVPAATAAPAAPAPALAPSIGATSPTPSEGASTTAGATPTTTAVQSTPASQRTKPDKGNGKRQKDTRPSTPKGKGP